MPNLFRRAADSTGTVERLTQSPNNQAPTAISQDGTKLVFDEYGPTPNDIMMLALDEDRRVLPLVDSTSFVERNGAISPDGRWLAYESNQSGRAEIYVRPFPDVNSGLTPASTAGGTRPLWARSGPELFYVAPSGALMTVPIERASTAKAGTPRKLFDWPLPIPAVTGRSYDVTADGRKFLMIKPVAGSESTPPPTSLIVVQHLDAELKRLLPAK